MTPSIAEGDPGKYAYLRNPNWRPKLFSMFGTMRKRDFCPGCTWPGEKRPHEGDNCELAKNARGRALT